MAKSLEPAVLISILFIVVNNIIVHSCQQYLQVNIRNLTF